MEEPEIELRLSRPGVSAVSSACAAPPLLSCSAPVSVPRGDTVGSPCPLSSVSTWLGLGFGLGPGLSLGLGEAYGAGLGLRSG